MKFQTILPVLFTLFVCTSSSIVRAQNDSLAVEFEMKLSEGLDSPLKLAIDRNDNIYVTDASARQVVRYAGNGRFIGRFSSGATPLAIVAAADGRLFVSDRQSGDIYKIDTSGAVIEKFANEFVLPVDATFDDEDRLYIADALAKKVRIFQPNGDELPSIGDSLLSFPTAVAFDIKNQRLLVSEHGGLDVAKVQLLIHVFDKQGVWLGSFGQYGYQAGKITRIQGLAVDDQGRIYIADTFLGVVTVLDENGNYLTTIGNYGTGQGELRAPMDVAIDSQKRIWIASRNNGSLEVYRTGGAPTMVRESRPAPLANGFQLLQNFPNPFNPQTEIPFILEKAGQVVLRIYNQRGQLIRKFAIGSRERGEGAIIWDATNTAGRKVASGIYVYEFRVDDSVAFRRMLLLK